MAVQPAICTQCGGTLNVDDANLNGFVKCDFCGTSNKVIDVITIDGLPTAKNFLISADLDLNDGNLEKAVKGYKEVIKIKANCHEAWWGLYLCNAAFDRYYNYEDKYGNSGPLIKANIMQNTIDKYAMHAIEFAPPEQADKYKNEIQGQLNYIEELRNGKKNKKSSSGFIKKLFRL